MVVERTFGVWKRRFPCLSKGLATKLETSPAIVVACAVLHNLARKYDDELPEDEDLYQEPPPEPEDEAPIARVGGQTEGFAVRAALVARLFT